MITAIDRYIGTAEFARAVGVRRLTIYRWIRDGRISPIRHWDRWIFPISEVEIFRNRPWKRKNKS